MTFLSSTFFQPIEFHLLEHEKRFKSLMILILVLTTVYVALFFLLAQIIGPGALFRKVDFLTDVPSLDFEDSMTKLTAIFTISPSFVTGLIMVTSEICAWVKSPSSVNVHPECSPGFIVNIIPFFTLNMSIVLAHVVRVVAAIFFKVLVPFWLNLGVVITTILVTNKLARKHVASRLRQQIDTFTIGGNNTAHPVVSIAVLPLRGQTGEAPTLGRPTRPAENTVGSIQLQPLRVRTLTGDAPTLPTATSATLCPVGE